MKKTRFIELKNGCILSPGLKPGRFIYGRDYFFMNINRRIAETLLEPSRSYVLEGMKHLDKERMAE